MRALMRGAPEMLASAKIPDRVQRLAEREGPRDETISANDPVVEMRILLPRAAYEAIFGPDPGERLDSAPHRGFGFRHLS